MSEEKLYAVKTDEGEFLSFSDDGDSVWNKAVGHFEMDKQKARSWAYNRGGHVVTLIEEPKKVVLSKKQAGIVEKARLSDIPATYISGRTDAYNGEESLLMNAYVNGYTAAKEKKYLVELCGLVTTDGAKQYLTKKNGKWFACRRMPGMHQDFTNEELNKAPEWAQQLDREEVTDDGIR
ncbi:DUF1642 domain-containing protein [Lacticaseibacillus paracasei]|uniref:DUF1642 domain-containing protein n=1 Tax=Lacticaseibacillus paracasei TaxID=1597 RepID=UPI001C1DE6CB|nr:DUF1642 domain-containing protein [Lacticaseibacillus paracasei]MBU6046290.1 DUF1642 domain-containing protein [Lacticaseibacillus paracasei]MCL4971185.1 DUF1642 domain-containing protein [Lacticaseibacillus paracasei]